MKPTPLKKIIISGLLASCFFLINCQNASPRKVKASMDPNAKQQQQQEDSTKFPPCNDKVATAVTARQSVLADIQTLLDLAAKQELPIDQKAKLQKLIIDLKTTSISLFREIKSIKASSGSAAIGCNTASSDNKKITYSISKMTAENTVIATKVKDITKESNVILDSKASDELINDTTMIESQVYKLKADLAAALRADKKDGLMYIADGKIFDSSTAKNDMQQLRTKNEKPFCYLEAASGDIKVDDKITVDSISSKVADDSKSASSTLLLKGDSQQIYVLTCIEQDIHDVPTQMRTIFGDLFTLSQGAKLSN